MNLFINKAYEDFNEFYEKIKTIKGYNMNIWDLLNNYINYQYDNDYGNVCLFESRNFCHGSTSDTSSNPDRSRSVPI